MGFWPFTDKLRAVEAAGLAQRDERIGIGAEVRAHRCAAADEACKSAYRKIKYEAAPGSDPGAAPHIKEKIISVSPLLLQHVLLLRLCHKVLHCR